MASSSSTSQRSPLADLPPDLFGRVIALLPLPADRARFRAVCRSWRSAMHDHVDTPQLPWIVHSDGTFVTLPNYYLHTWSPFPENTKLVGATGSWLAVYRTDANGGPRRYMLHNPFSHTTVPLPGLDSVIGRVSDGCMVRKVLLRSTQDDLVAVTTNMRDCRIILCRPGKFGTWSLKRRALPYARICDVAFLGDTLYAVTSDEQLIELEIIGQREDGRPMVKSAKYVIKHFLGHDEGAEQEDGEDESEVSSSEDDEVVEPSEASSLAGKEAFEYNDTSSVEADDDDDDDDDDDNDIESSGTSSIEDDDQDTESTSDEESDDDNEVENNLKDVDLDGYCSNPDDVEENEFMDYTVTKRCLLESGGKLLMIRRRRFTPCHSTRLGREFVTDSEVDDDSDVEMLVADLQVGSWVPAVTTCMFFIGDHFSKSIHGCGEAYEESDCYFVDEHDVTITRARTFPEFLDWTSMWFYPPEIVV